MRAVKCIDDYIEQRPQWATALQKLRSALRGSDLEETIRWGRPCYTLEGAHVAGIAVFQSHVGLWFHQGVFLSDPDGVLINCQDGKTKAEHIASAKQEKTKVARLAKILVMIEAGVGLNDRYRR